MKYITIIKRSSRILSIVKKKINDKFFIMCFGFKKYITLLLSLSTLEHICNALLRRQTTITHIHSVCSVKQIKWTPPPQKKEK